jgi:predicted transcriptional regulator
MDFSVLFGSEAAKQTLLYIENYEKGYAAEIAETFGVSASMIQKQLNKFEEADVLVATKFGRLKVFEFNPRYPVLNELKSLLSGLLALQSKADTKNFFRKRSRPRRKGKPL